MPQLESPKKVPVPPEDHAAHEAARKPGPSDVHEQRQQKQEQEAVVERSGSRRPTQSTLDEERGDWEGMGQGSPRPD